MRKLNTRLSMSKRQLLSIIFFHIGHNTDRLLYMLSPTYEWAEDKLADLYQWAMKKSAGYDDYYKVWTNPHENESKTKRHSRIKKSIDTSKEFFWDDDWHIP